MARIRTIKPDFWTDGNIVALSPFARLLYIGMWNFTMCDHGHVADDAMKLKLQVLPMDDIDIVALLSELLDSERVTRVVDPEGRTYLHVTRFEDHQKIDPRWKTRCSACTHRDSLILAETHPSLDVAHPNSPKLTLGRDGKGRDGKGKDKETAPRKRGARLSDDWNPSESLNAAMTEERPDIDLTAELRIFRDYWIAQPGQRGIKTDWDATWRNWIRRARPTVRPGAQQNGISRQDAKVNGYLAYANLDNQKEIS